MEYDLWNRRVLVVEDEYLLARDLKAELESLGSTVLGPEPSVERALDRLTADGRIDAAILDVNLGGELVFAVADALVLRRVPFIFISGYDDSVTQAQYPEIVKCDKPIDKKHLLDALQTLIGR